MYPGDQGFWARTLEIWVQGGWGMIPLAFVAFLLFALAFYIWIDLRQRGADHVPLEMIKQWVDYPDQRKGHVGEVINYTIQAHDLEEVDKRFKEIRVAELEPVSQTLKMMRVCITAAPLIGLLGTVTGMLATFAAMGKGSGGEETMKLVSLGISEALFTTAQGLIIALPGYFANYQLTQSKDRYAAFLEHLESACMQRIYRNITAARKKATV